MLLARLAAVRDRLIEDPWGLVGLSPASWRPPERISPTLTTEDLSAALARANPVAARLLGRIEPTLPFAQGDLEAMPLPSPDRTPECGAEPGAEGDDRTPQRTPKRRERTPKAPRRALHWYEVPDMPLERLERLQEGCDEPPAGHPIEVHALRLLMLISGEDFKAAVADPPIASERGLERGLFAYQVEDAYHFMCLNLHWGPHRWGGTNGVAQHLRRMLYGRTGGTMKDGRLPYKYVIEPDGSIGRDVFYPLPKRTLARGQRVVQLAPQRTPKASKRTPRLAPTASPSRVRKAA
jgi:hypothetical protein